MRIKTIDKIIEIDQIEYDLFNKEIYINKNKYTFSSMSDFYDTVHSLLTKGYGDLSQHEVR